MGVKIIVDSTADLIPQVRSRVEVVPLTIRFGQEEYIDGVTIDSKTFYEKLIESDVMPTTCQIPPAEFESAYEKVMADGDTAVVVTLSGKLSGTYQSAVIAAENYSGKVFVVDSESVAIGERILVLRGLELKEEGLSAKEIAEKLDEEKKYIRLLGLLDTLEYLKKGGRISSAAAFAGNLLSIKPVITAENGELKLLGKARGSRQGNNLLREMVAKTGGIRFDKPFYLAYSGLSKMILLKYINDSAELWEGRVMDLPVTTVGCAIGAHVGPGAIAIAYFEK